jgi:hypothetical protein
VNTGSVGTIVVDGKFGPATVAAVKKFQMSKGLVSDGVVGPATGAALAAATVAVITIPAGPFPAGCTSNGGFSTTTGMSCAVSLTLPAGCTSTAGYSSTTGVKCSTSTSLPAGCTSTSGYSSTTGAKCDGSSTGSTGSTSTGSDEGELDSFDTVSADENSFSEDEEAVELFAFEMEADGSDMMVSRVDVYMDETAGAGDSDNADDYFDTAYLLVDGEEVAELDVDDFDEDDWGVVTGANGDEYRLRFDADFVVEDGDTVTVSVAFDTAGTIDSGDESATWTFDIQDDAVRAEDEAGFSDEYGPSANTEETVNVDGADTGELDVSLSTDNPEEQIVEVDDSDDTDGVEVLAFELKLTMEISMLRKS